MDAHTLTRCILALPASQAVLIRAAPGEGKSDIVASIAEQLGKELIDVRAAVMTEGDVCGYPNVALTEKLGVACFALPSWYVRACNEPCILFLDELNRALISVLNSLFQIVLNRELGSGPDGKPKRLHPETQIFAAVNWGHEFTVSEMDPALLSRFWVVDYKATIEDWITWARKNKIDDLLIDFIRQNPSHWRPTKQVESGKIVPNPRSWFFFDRAMKNAGVSLSECGGTTPELLYPIATGFVGVEASASLVDYVKNYMRVVTAEMVLNDWKTIESGVKELTTEKHLSIIEKLKTHCQSNAWTLDQVKNVKKFFDCLTGEGKMQLYNSVLSTGKTSNVSLFHNQVGAQIMKVIEAASKLQSKN